MIRVLLVDDHPVVLAGLSAMVEAADDLEVIGVAGSVAGTLAIASEPAPDVCVLDLHLPDGDGMALGATLRERWPSTRIMILTMTQDPSTVFRSLARGADSFVLKDSPPHELLGAVRATASGSVVLSHGASASVRAVASTLPDTDPLARLDARDREVLALMVGGLSSHQVAARLFLAPKTVRNRTSEMLTKLGVANREDAIALAIAGGLGLPERSGPHTLS